MSAVIVCYLQVKGLNMKWGKNKMCASRSQFETELTMRKNEREREREKEKEREREVPFKLWM